jgi:hypothetical protein
VAPAPGPAPAKIAPKKFKPIPDAAPAKELGEYLREMIRAADVSLDRVAAAGRIAKNTLTTTMDGRSKGWPSIQQWITAYNKAVGVPAYTRQIDEIRHLYQLGRHNHLAALRTARTTKTAAGTTEPAPASPAAPAAAEEDLPAPEWLLVEISIKLPRRTPGASIDPDSGQVLDDDEIEARVEATKKETLRRRLREGPIRYRQEPDKWFTSVTRGPWTAVYLSTAAPYRVLRPRRWPKVRLPAYLPSELPSELPSDPSPDPCEPTTGAPAGLGPPAGLGQLLAAALEVTAPTGENGVAVTDAASLEPVGDWPRPTQPRPRSKAPPTP